MAYIYQQIAISMFECMTNITYEYSNQQDPEFGHQTSLYQPFPHLTDQGAREQIAMGMRDRAQLKEEMRHAYYIPRDRRGCDIPYHSILCIQTFLAYHRLTTVLTKVKSIMTRH